MPKLITTYQIVRVFDDDEEVFAETAILPNIPSRFALIQKSTESSEKSKLIALATADKVLHWLAIMTMTSRGETRVESLSRYFTASEFEKYADSQLDKSIVE